ncbi:MAG: hypothetical protein JWM40_1896 [Frankiales bacterium]|nr:hypothetical protein [Frankiales bacterium]
MSEWQRMQDQLAGVTAWRHAVELRAAAELAHQGSREGRLEASRRLQALRRADAMVAAWTDRAAQGTGRRAVVAHRQDWVREKLSLSLSDHDIDVLTAVEDGAEALGVTIAAQPELVILESRLPSLLAVDLVRDIRTFAPGTLIAAQVESDQEVASLVDAGARALFGRQVRPTQLAEQVADYLRTQPDKVLLVT